MDMPTPVNYRFLKVWRAHAGDPDDQPEVWFKDGAPAGIEEQPLESGVFPTNEPEDLEDADGLVVDEDDFSNCPGVEYDDDAWEEVQRLAGLHRLAECATWGDVCKLVDGQPVLSKIGMIKKLSAGKVKKRLIVDSKRSRVSKAARKLEQVVLPEVTDVVNDALHQKLRKWQLQRRDSITEWMVLDFSDAFFVLPLHRRERRFFVVRLRGRFFVFKVQAQGASASPLI